MGPIPAAPGQPNLPKPQVNGAGHAVLEVNPEAVAADRQALRVPVEDVPIACWVVAEEISTGGRRGRSGLIDRSRVVAAQLGVSEPRHVVPVARVGAGELELDGHG